MTRTTPPGPGRALGSAGRAWPMRWWRWPGRTCPRRSPPRATRTSTRWSCTSAPKPSPASQALATGPSRARRPGPARPQTPRTSPRPRGTPVGQHRHLRACRSPDSLRRPLSPGGRARRAFPRKRPAAHSRRPAAAGQLGTRRTRGAATSTTARPSARRRPGPWPAGRRCRGCCTTTTAPCSTSAAGTAAPPPRCAAPSANATTAGASSPAAGRGAPTSTTSSPGPKAARPPCAA